MTAACGCCNVFGSIVVTLCLYGIDCVTGKVPPKVVRRSCSGPGSEYQFSELPDVALIWASSPLSNEAARAGDLEYVVSDALFMCTGDNGAPCGRFAVAVNAKGFRGDDCGEVFVRFSLGSSLGGKSLGEPCRGGDLDS